MDVSPLLRELYGRLDDLVPAAVEGLGADELAARVGPDANSIGWLVWHLTRVQDHHVAELLDDEQRYLSEGWARRFGLAADAQDIGYGHTWDDVAAVRPATPDLLVDYYRSVAARTRDLLDRVTPDDLDRIVDRRWDPPVTLGVRLVSIADDGLQHAGQAAFVRGVLGR